MTTHTTTKFIERSGELTTAHGDTAIAGLTGGKLVVRLYTDDDLADLTREDLVAMIAQIDKAEAELQP